MVEQRLDSGEIRTSLDVFSSAKTAEILGALRHFIIITVTEIR